MPSEKLLYRKVQDMQVPEASIALMVFSCAMGVVIPVVLFIWLRRRGADVLPFFVGCAVMIVFAYVLEGGAHSLVFGSGARTAIEGSVWSYAVYVGLMAGVFEESGRFIAFKTLLRGRWGNDGTALMYGAGHGGLEAFMVLTIGMASSLALAAAVNSGQAASIAEGLSAEAAAQVEAAIALLVESQPVIILLGVLERIIAVVLHMSLSVLVWFAAKVPGRLLMFPAAVVAHAVVDALAVLLPAFGMSAGAVEVVFAAVTAAVMYFAWLAWKRDARPARIFKNVPSSRR